MGWLELLPLLKRLLPLLDRLAPLLESILAGRFSGRAEAEHVSSAAIAEVSRSHGDLQQGIGHLQRALEEQRGHVLTAVEQTQRVHNEVQVLTRSVETLLVRLESAGRQNTALLHLLRGGLAVLLLLLVTAVVLLVLILRQHT